jgi:hypothetical protein
LLCDVIKDSKGENSERDETADAEEARDLHPRRA